jgi:hypothetical protein
MLDVRSKEVLVKDDRLAVKMFSRARLRSGRRFCPGCVVEGLPPENIAEMMGIAGRFV